MNINKILAAIGRTTTVALLLALFHPVALAGEGALLGLSPSFPKIAFSGLTGQGCNYDASTDTLTITSNPGFTLVTAAGPFGFISNETTSPFTPKLLTIVLNINDLGGLTGGSFTLDGELTAGITTYTTPLLTGTFGGVGPDYGLVDLNPTGGTDPMDMQATVTGGSMASLFTSKDIAIAPMSLEQSTYSGTMTTDWLCQRAKGTIGSVPSEVVGAGACSQGFWKNHMTQWPVANLSLGSISYDQSQLLAILSMKTKGDKSIAMAKQLIGAKLNVAGGSDPACISSVITAADAWLDANATLGILPGNVSSWNGGEDIKDDLDDFNNGACAGACER